MVPLVPLRTSAHLRPWAYSTGGSPMQIAKLLQESLPVCLKYLSQFRIPLRGFLLSTTGTHGFSGSTTNANQTTLTSSGRPSPRQLLLRMRNRMTRRRGRHLSQPTTTRCSAVVWDGTLPRGCTGFVPGISRLLMICPSVTSVRSSTFRLA